MTKAKEFRVSIRELLELLSSKEKQLAYKTKVPKANVASELICMWFDDLFYPETDLFKSAFKPHEINQLALFNNAYEGLTKKLPDNFEDYRTNKEWNQVMVHARQTLDHIQW
jgi:hypothetical protein